jgi:hypothetical protein
MFDLYLSAHLLIQTAVVWISRYHLASWQIRAVLESLLTPTQESNTMSTNNNQQQTTGQLESALSDYISGAARTNPALAKSFVDHKGWAQAAQAIIDRRATAFLECLDADVLEAIASGQIDLPNCAKATLAN